jgi:hypothetical protein
VEQARLAAIAEAARQAELRRLEAQQQAEEAAAAAKAAELAKQAAKALAERVIAAEAARVANLPPPPELFDLGDDCPDEVGAKTETEKAIEAVRYAPATVVAKPIGITLRTRLVLRVVDAAKVPDVFVVRTVNEKAISTVYCNGWKKGQPLPTVPGCEFTVEETAVSTGRGF